VSVSGVDASITWREPLPTSPLADEVVAAATMGVPSAECCCPPVTVAGDRNAQLKARKACTSALLQSSTSISAATRKACLIAHRRLAAGSPAAATSTCASARTRAIDQREGVESTRPTPLAIFLPPNEMDDNGRAPPPRTAAKVAPPVRLCTAWRRAMRAARSDLTAAFSQALRSINATQRVTAAVLHPRGAVGSRF